MPSFYQVYNVDEIMRTDLEHSDPTTLTDAFSQSAQQEAQNWFIDSHDFWGRYEISDREKYVPQPSPWGYETTKESD